MRIISWNMQGKYIQPAIFRETLHRLRIDAVIVQEPPVLAGGYDLDATHVRARTSSRFSPAALAADWRTTHVPAGNPNGQDRYMILWNADSMAMPVHSIIPDTGDVPDNHRRQAMIVTLRQGAETLRIATAHAPYVATDRAFTQAYMSELLNHVSTMADLFMGDTNLEAFVEAGRDFAQLMSSPSTNAADANPYDRIIAFTEAGGDGGARYGRIFATDTISHSKSSRDRRNPQMIDVCATTTGVWGAADHFAIYFDSEPTTADSVDSASNSGAFNRRTQGEFVELTFTGRSAVSSAVKRNLDGGHDPKRSRKGGGDDDDTGSGSSSSSSSSSSSGSSGGGGGDPGAAV